MKIDLVAFTPDDLPFLPEEARPRLCADTRGVVAVTNTGELVAAAIMDSWTENSCMIHVYIGNPMVLRHNFAEEVFKYVFVTSGRKVIIGCTPADNEKALKFNAHMGFKQITRIKDAYAPGIDLVVTEMRKENCKWIQEFERAA